MQNEMISRRSFLGGAALSVLGGALVLTGCAGSNQQAASSSGSSASQEPSQAASPAAVQEPSSASSPAASPAAAVPAQGNLGKVLVAYYSASGNTRAAAEMIAADLDADLFDITPVQPYTADDLDWPTEGSRVNLEHDDPSQRDTPLVQVTPEGFAEYDTVILGYPIWWAIAAWPVDGFVAGNDFTGKTVIPFCTSTSSGLGSSATELEALAGTGTWLEGHRFPSSVTEAEVASWVETL